MRKVPLACAAAVLVLGLAGGVSFAAVSQASVPGPAKSQTLVFKVVFSPFEPVQANNVRIPKSPFALGDEIVAHDQLFSHGQDVGDDALSCVIVAAPPDALLANCTGIFRVPGGTIAIQTTAIPGPAPKQLAVTGGTGRYRNAGGDGTLVEFGNGKGKLTLHLLSLVARGGGG
jgi:allene oxide cyclase-like protein